MFLYLWVLFALFSIHKSMVLAEEHINYQAQGLAIVNASDWPARIVVSPLTP